VLISEEKLNERIAQLGEQISKDYEGKEVKLICILKGSIIFTCELAKRITVPVKFDFMQVSSYGSGTSSSGQIKIKKDLDESIEGEQSLLICSPSCAILSFSFSSDISTLINGSFIVSLLCQS